MPIASFGHSGPGCGIIDRGAGRCDIIEPPDPGGNPPPPGPGGGGGGGSGGGGGNGKSDYEKCLEDMENNPSGDPRSCIRPDGEGGPGGGPAPVVPPPVPSAHDFMEFDIPSSTPHAKPDDWTVVGKPTAFWADSSVREFDAVLLGHTLRVRATPVSYHWDFGDGEAQRTKGPGSEPRRPSAGSITHTYADPEDVSVVLTTVYSGEYRYGDGEWLPIDGTASVESAPLDITVYRYHRYRVDDDCRADPHGTDC